MNSLKNTGNNLADIIDWIKSGNVVSLNNGCKILTYHNNCGKDLNSSHKVVNVNVRNQASLLNDDEWPWYFNLEGCQICSCKSMNFNLGY